MFGSSQVKGNIIIKNVILIRVKFVHIQPNDTQLISNWLTSTSELSSVYLRSIQHEDKSSEIDAMDLQNIVYQRNMKPTKY